jgi:hypothetical protein
LRQPKRKIYKSTPLSWHHSGEGTRIEGLRVQMWGVSLRYRDRLDSLGLFYLGIGKHVYCSPKIHQDNKLTFLKKSSYLAIGLPSSLGRAKSPRLSISARKVGTT